MDSDKHQRNVERQLRFEQLLSALSSAFVGLAAGCIEKRIHEEIRHLVEFLGMDRGILLEFTGEKPQLHATHLWEDDEADDEGESGSSHADVPIEERFPWLASLILRQETIAVSRLAELPPAAKLEREYCEARGIRSFVVIPLATGDSLLGAILLDVIRAERAWPSELIKRLGLVGEIFANALSRSKSERALHSSEARLAEAQRISHIGNWDLDLLTHDLHWSDEIYRIFGLAPQEFAATYEAFLRNVHPEDRPSVEQAVDTAIETGAPYDLDHRIVLPNGLERIVHERAEVTRDASGAPIRMVGTVQDITERKRIARAVQASERTFSTVFHASPVAMLFLDEDRRIGKINRAAEKILGGSASEIAGLAFGDAIHCFFIDEGSPGCGSGPSCDQCTVRGIAHDTLETGRTSQGVETRLTLKPKVGPSVSGKAAQETKYLRISTSLLELADDRQVLVCIEDITAQKQAELELQKAFSEIHQLKEQLRQENVYLREEAKLQYEHDEIIGQSKVIKLALEQVELVADTDATVLLQGETGTGKEVLARAIHRLSPRSDRTMVTVNCAALPSTLVESELFGREAGAYTGALSRQVGRFEIANRSTILLDEIGELPLELQAKLLRVLQEGQFQRLGSSKDITVDVRVIAATNRNLTEAMAKGKFREDLYHRLNVFPIDVPALRERTDDIPSLVWAFAKEFGDKMGKTFTTIPRRTMDALQSYAWPGNVRELRNVVERAAILSSGDSLLVEAPRSHVKTVGRVNTMTLDECQRKHVTDVLESVGWRIRGKRGAAELLGAKASTLESKMAKLGIVRPK